MQQELSKTKAALPGRQCQSTKLKPIQNSTLVDLVNMTEGGIPPSPNDRTVTATAGGISTDLHGVYPKLDTPQKYKVCEIFRTPHQPFGSMPRCCSSLRSMRLIQVARDESPSFRISSSSCERNSSLNRIWYCGDFFSSCIDTCNYPSYHLNVTTRVITFELKSNAPECGNTTEASHQTVIRGNDHG